MATVTVEILGLKELDRALNELPSATGKAVLRKVLKEAGEPIARAARAGAPTEEGYLIESIDVSPKLSRRQAGLHKAMYPDDRASAEMFVGTNNPAGVQQEFGNSRHGAQPFMRPAWDSQKEQALFIIEHLLWTEIEKGAKRVAARAARLR